MIIIGYQGIGKSSIAGRNDIIDLESSNFWHKHKRPDNWYVYYCNIAEHLSKQGYIVFVSSHEVVRNRLRKYSNESVYCVFPSIRLKDEWIDKLHKRYEKTGKDKDFKAWMNAVDRYRENITELMQANIQFYEIRDMDYRLEDIVYYLVEFDSEWHKKK